MKRATDTRDETASQKASKLIRAESPSVSPAKDRFAAEFEVQAAVLADTPLDEAKYIVGQVFMLWPISKNARKIQMSTASSALDVVFEGTGVEKLDFLSKDKVKLSLKGARKEAKKLGSPHTLPFKLVFPQGAIVLFVASEKREEDKLVDLFEDAEDEDRRAEDDWFLPSLDVNPVNDVFGASTEYITHATEPDYLLFESRQFQDPSIQISKPDPRLSKGTPQTSHIDSHAHEQADSEPDAHYVHYIGTSRTEISYPTLKGASNTLGPDQTMKSSYAPVPTAPSLQVLPNSPLAEAPRRKDKRLKKRDTRHSRDSIDGPALDIGRGHASDPPDTDTKRQLGKKARKRLAARARAQMENAQIHPLPSPPPSHDPALDLVAGFHSEKGGLYTPVERVEAGRSHCLVGIVADASVIKTTKTGDRCKSFVLVDPSRYESGLTVGIFVSSTDEQILPSANIGQVLLLRRVKVKEFQGKLQGTCYKDSFQWCGYDPAEGKHFYTEVVAESSPPSSASQSTHDAFFKPSAPEMEYFVKLADWWRALKEAQEKERESIADESLGNVTIHIVAPTARGRQKLQTIAELEHETFVDCVVELLKIWIGDSSSSIYVTDYSENKYLENNHVAADGFPLGRRTLKVTLWDEDSAIAEDLEVHGLYILKNMRLKKRESSRTYLEGSMGYQDRGIHKLGQGSTQENLQELITRKKEYEENPHSSHLPPEEDERVPEPMQQGHMYPTRELSRVSESSSIVECLHMDQTRSTIESVRRSNKCPNKFRIRARISEYYPRRIEDFVAVECKSCYKILDDGYRLCPDCGDLSESSTTVRYQFALRVVDESQEELNIGVSSDEANEFLFGLDAKDARDDTMALRNRLAPLLGHLDKWHEGFDEETNCESGPWVDMCVSSWIPEMAEESETVRLYKLFGSRLCNRTI